VGVLVDFHCDAISWELRRRGVRQRRIPAPGNAVGLTSIVHPFHSGSILVSQPRIPQGSLNRVPASAGLRAGMSPLSGGR